MLGIRQAGQEGGGGLQPGARLRGVGGCFSPWCSWGCGRAPVWVLFNTDVGAFETGAYEGVTVDAGNGRLDGFFLLLLARGGFGELEAHDRSGGGERSGER